MGQYDMLELVLNAYSLHFDYPILFHLYPTMIHLYPIP